MSDKQNTNDETNALLERLEKLAFQKSHYQMVAEVLLNLAEIQGLENLAVNSVLTIMNFLGGTNVQLYYYLADEWYFCDIATSPRLEKRILDPDVLSVIESGNLLERENQDQQKMDSGSSTDECEQSKDWYFPLNYKNKIIGVLVMKGVLVEYTHSVRNEISTIVSFLTQSLNQEINSSTLMQDAYSRLSEKSFQLEREMEEKSREQLKFRQTIDSSFDGFWIVDTTGRFLDVNQAYCDLTGYTKKEILQMSIADLEVNEDGEDTARHIDKIKAQGRERFESIHRKKNGDIFEVEVNASYSADEDSFYVFIKDLRNIKALEIEKHKLEQFQNQRSKMESIGRLAGGIAHDLNNLLTPIIGYSELLLMDLENDEEPLKKVDSILQASLSAKDIIRQLLAFSRKQELEYNYISLNDILLKFEKLLARTIREDISLNISLTKASTEILADKGQIEQVILNLIVNAQDSMTGIPDGKISVKTETAVLSRAAGAELNYLPEGEYVLLSIEDNGSGIDKRIQENIFEPFFSTKGELGTGLGLATVLGIVNQHGGTIVLNSTPGKGSMFTVYLPLKTQKCTAASTANQIDLSGQKEKTILLCEDNDLVLKMTEAMLISLGFTVLTANSPSRALTLCRESKQIDLLLTDIIMPEVNGIELCCEIRSILPHIRVLFMSGYLDDTLPQLDIENLKGSYIQKPFTLNVLSQKIKELLETTDTAE
ncbi:MAG: ATP-binding protein [Spirochaetales bacterium]|nr:ATP-binding protein [Spirochaetales bacterium]